MSRDIRFRAWNGYTMTTPYLYGSFIYLTGRDLEDGNQYAGPVMQFTGLLDKNGVDIYEGDILRWDVNEISVVAPVGYEGGGFYMLRAINSKMGYVYNDWLRGEYTVLGNIHANPELIGDSNE